MYVYIRRKLQLMFSVKEWKDSRVLALKLIFFGTLYNVFHIFAILLTHMLPSVSIIYVFDEPIVPIFLENAIEEEIFGRLGVSIKKIEVNFYVVVDDLPDMMENKKK
ncbi:hypothetical protein ACJX0J_037786 [Zea mays]